MTNMTRGKHNGTVTAKKPANRGSASNPEWEAMKGGCRNLRPAEAVRECAYLSAQYRSMFSMPEIDLRKILMSLQTKKIPFVLTGAHGFAVWTGRPRATHDVDILVKAGPSFSRALRAIQTLFPELEVRNSLGVASFFVVGEKLSVIDVMEPFRADLTETLDTAIGVEDHGASFHIPTLETALTNKYAASRSPDRDSVERAMDVIDAYWMIRHSLDQGRTPIDLERLAELGELVWPGGGGAEIIKFVEEAKAGKVPNPNA
jgi:hypothetical protein